MVGLAECLRHGEAGLCSGCSSTPAVSNTLHLSGDSCELSGASKGLILEDVSSVGMSFHRASNYGHAVPFFLHRREVKSKIFPGQAVSQPSSHRSSLVIHRRAMYEWAEF